MRRIFREKAWLRFLFYAVVFGTVTQAFNALLGGSFRLIPGLIGGVVFGAGMIAVEAWQRKKESARP